MIAEVWESHDGEGVQITVFPKERTEVERKVLLGDAPCTLLRQIEADTWDGVMTKHYELMGWKPYVPMED